MATPAPESKELEDDKKEASQSISLLETLAAFLQQTKQQEADAGAKKVTATKSKATISHLPGIIDSIRLTGNLIVSAKSQTMGDDTTGTSQYNIQAGLVEKRAELVCRYNERKNTIPEKDARRAAALHLFTTEEAYLKLCFNKLVEHYTALQPVFQCYYNLLRVASLPNTTKASVEADGVLNGFLKEYPLEKQHIVVDEFFMQSRIFNARSEEFKARLEQEKDLEESDKAAFKILQPIWEKEAARITSKIKTRNLNQMIDSAVCINTHLRSDYNYEYTSSPIQPAADIVVFDIDIKSHRKSYFNDERSFSYRDFVRGGLRYDFSTGILFNLGIADHHYRIETEDEGNGPKLKIYENGQKNQYIPQIAAMFHASIRSSSYINLGFTLGASINTEKLDIGSIFPGLSLMVGHRNKAVLTVGPSLKKVELLKSKYDQNERFPVGSIQEDALTVQVYRVGWFIGVSYNLTQAQRSNIKL